MLENDPSSIPSASDSRALIVEADASTCDRVGLKAFWRLLLCGGVKLTGSFSDQRRHFATFRQSQEPVRGLSERRREFLERCLLGESPKSVASDCRVAHSTVATAVVDCFREMGIVAAGSRAPMLLVVAAHASRGEGRIRTARRCDVSGSTEQALSIPRPDTALSSRLSPAELSIARLLADGHNYAEIAGRRGTSVRTIANQIASLFQKLGLSGRSELLHYAVLAYDPRQPVRALHSKSMQASLAESVGS